MPKIYIEPGSEKINALTDWLSLLVFSSNSQGDLIKETYFHENTLRM